MNKIEVYQQRPIKITSDHLSATLKAWKEWKNIF